MHDEDIKNYEQVTIEKTYFERLGKMRVPYALQKKRRLFELFFHVNLFMNLYLSKFFPYYKREHHKCYFFPYLDSRNLFLALSTNKV